MSPKAVFIDGTHIKANANTKKAVKAQIPAASRHYAEELMEEVNADREAHGKNRLMTMMRMIRLQYLRNAETTRPGRSRPAARKKRAAQ